MTTEIIESRANEVAPLELKPQHYSLMLERVQSIEEIMRKAMKPGIHFGVVPGTDKPTILKPGVEVLMVLFNFTSTTAVGVTELGDGHREYNATATIWTRGGMKLGEGVGSCSTKESKYAYRKGKRLCPQCGAEAIIKGKEDFGGGWLCWKKKDGCGAKFADHDPAIIGQEVDRVSNPDIADSYNTCLKMAKIRALRDAVLTVTGASAIFTQDMEDGDDPGIEEAPPLKTKNGSVKAQVRAVVALENPWSHILQGKKDAKGKTIHTAGKPLHEITEEQMREALTNPKIRKCLSDADIVNMEKCIELVEASRPADENYPSLEEDSIP